MGNTRLKLFRGKDALGPTGHLSNFWSFRLRFITLGLLVVIFSSLNGTIQVYAEEKEKISESESDSKRDVQLFIDNEKFPCDTNLKEFNKQKGQVMAACASLGFVPTGGKSDSYLQHCKDEFNKCLGKTETGYEEMISDIKKFVDGDLDKEDYQKTESYKLKKAAYEVLLARANREPGNKKKELTPKKIASLKKEAGRLLESFASDYADRASGGGDNGSFAFAGESGTLDEEDYRKMDEILKEMQKAMGKCDGIRGSKAADLKSLLEVREKKRDQLKDEISKVQESIKEFSTKIDEKDEAVKETDAEIQKLGGDKAEVLERIKVELSRSRDDFSKTILTSYQEEIKRKTDRIKITADIESETKKVRVGCSKNAKENLSAWIAAVKLGRIKIPSSDRYSFLSSKVKKQYQSYYDQCMKENSATLSSLEAQLKNIHEITRDYDHYTTVMLNKNGETLRTAENQANRAAQKNEQDKNQAIVFNYQKKMDLTNNLMSLHQERNKLEDKLRQKEMSLEKFDFVIEGHTKEFESALNAGDKKADYKDLALINGTLSTSFDSALSSCCKEFSNKNFPTEAENILKDNAQRDMNATCISLKKNNAESLFESLLEQYKDDDPNSEPGKAEPKPGDT